MRATDLRGPSWARALAGALLLPLLAVAGAAALALALVLLPLALLAGPLDGREAP